MGATPPTSEALNQFASAENLALHISVAHPSPTRGAGAGHGVLRRVGGVPQKGQRQFQRVEGEVRVLSHLPCAPGAKPSPAQLPASPRHSSITLTLAPLPVNPSSQGSVLELCTGQRVPAGALRSAKGTGNTRVGGL